MIGIFKRGSMWWARVPRIGSAGVQRSLGTGDKKVAQHVAFFLGTLKQAADASAGFLLDEMASGRLAILDAYRAYAEQRLPAFVEALRNPKVDVLLEPLVVRWESEMIRLKHPTARVRQKYMQQVRSFATPTRVLNELTRPNIRQWLQELPVTQPNRYRAALSGFCEFLVLEELLDFNPVRTVPASKEATPRDRHLLPDEASRLVFGTPREGDRALQALLICTAADVESALQVRRRDIDLEKRTVFIRGTKKAWRTRYCYVYDRWSDLWALVESWLKANPAMPDTLVFQSLGDYDGVWKRTRKVIADLKIDDYTMKDHRHTWAVQAFKDRLPIHAIYQQLGHRDATMALKVYGKYQVRAEDYRMHEPAVPVREAM